MEALDFSKIVNVIKSNESFSIYSHMRTDIDAVASSLALKRALENMGKTAHVFIDSIMPENSKGLNGIEKINNQKQTNYDVCIVLDCPDKSRLARLKFKFFKNTKTSIQIDHHQGNNMFCRHNYVDTNASSTCEIIFELLNELNAKFDTDIYKLLLSGILTDTGGLKYNTSAKTLKIASNILSSSKLPMEEISYPLTEIGKTTFNIKKRAYEVIETYYDDKVAIICLNKDDFARANATLANTDSLVSIATELESVKITALMSEPSDEPGTFYVSLRSKDCYVVRNVAAVFGGGGHERASGCRIFGPADEVKKQLLNAIKQEIDRCGGA